MCEECIADDFTIEELAQKLYENDETKAIDVLSKVSSKPRPTIIKRSDLAKGIDPWNIEMDYLRFFAVEKDRAMLMANIVDTHPGTNRRQLRQLLRIIQPGRWNSQNFTQYYNQCNGTDSHTNYHFFMPYEGCEFIPEDKRGGPIPLQTTDACHALLRGMRRAYSLSTNHRDPGKNQIIWDAVLEAIHKFSNESLSDTREVADEVYDRILIGRFSPRD